MGLAKTVQTITFLAWLKHRATKKQINSDSGIDDHEGKAECAIN